MHVSNSAHLNIYLSKCVQVLYKIYIIWHIPYDIMLLYLVPYRHMLMLPRTL